MGKVKLSEKMKLKMKFCIVLVLAITTVNILVEGNTSHLNSNNYTLGNRKIIVNDTSTISNLLFPFGEDVSGVKRNKRESIDTSPSATVEIQLSPLTQLTKQRTNALFNMIQKLSLLVESNKGQIEQMASEIIALKENTDARIRNQSSEISLLRSTIIENLKKTNEDEDNEVEETYFTPTKSSLPEEIIPTNATLGVEKEKLLKYLKSISGSKTITGLYVYNTGENRTKGREHIESISGVLPGILTSRMPGYSAEVAEWQSFINETISDWNDGYLIQIVWGIKENPLTSKDILKDGNETDWNDLITDSSHLNNIWKREMDTLAPYLHQLQTAGVVAVIDILPCMNYKWAMWNQRRGFNGSQKLYQMTHDYLTQHHGLSSLVWMWSLYSTGEMTNLKDYWPGKDYVDVVSVHMWYIHQLNTTEYQEILGVVGEKPIVMEVTVTVPTHQLMTEQPQWTWFTVNDKALLNPLYNSPQNVNATFNSPAIIHRGNNDFFNN